VKKIPSFKDANFWKQFKSRSGTLTPARQVIKPLPPPKPGLVLTPEFQAEQLRKKKEMVAFINQQRCPLCQNQLDGEASAGKAAVYCVSSPDHYTANYDAQKVLKWYSIRLHFNDLTYILDCAVHGPSQTHIIVFKNNRSQHDRYRKEIFRFTGELPELNLSTSEEEFLSELKLFALLS
jgi:hypothetical protein